MISLVDYFKCKQLPLNTTSSTPISASLNASNALEKSNDKYFQTCLSPKCNTPTSSPFFWQIEFPLPVTIESYTFSVPSSKFSWFMKLWEVSFSLDNITFSSLPASSCGNLLDNKNKFLLPFPIYCKHFKITSLLCNYNEYNRQYFALNSFECFGSLGKKIVRVANQCSYTFASTMNKVISSIMIFLQ